MGLRRYFVILIVITGLGVSYVHQQFLIVEANYIIKKRERALSQLLDRNAKLRYNVNALESPSNLEARLKDSGIKCGAPKAWVKVERAETRSARVFAKNTEGRMTLVDRVLNFITIKAEAKTTDNK